MTGARDTEDWVARARAMPIKGEIERRGIGLKANGAAERCGPCPVCGGEDRFSINIRKQVFNCRGCGKGGDVIALVQHLDGVEFIAACETLTGEPRPNGKDRTAQVRVAQFDYHDRDGAVAFAVERVEYRNPDGSPVLTSDGKPEKTFRQKRPDPDRPGEWLWNVKGVPSLPYRLGELTEAIASECFIVIVEGEAKADLLRGWNVPATCNAGGAGKWRQEHAAFFRGAHVVVIPDHDPQAVNKKTGEKLYHPDGRPRIPGRDHAESVAASLHGIASSIQVLELPGLPPKGDVIDWARNGGTVERLHELIELEAKPWTPKAEDEAQEARAPEFSDEALALQFADYHADDLRYVAFWSQWLFWERWRWTEDETLAAFDRARAICREAAATARKAKLATMLASAKTVAAVERLSKADRRLAATAEQWDDNDGIFNSPETTI